MAKTVDSGANDTRAGALEQLYARIFLIRRFEETLLDLFARGEISGTTHTCIGQEADAVGSAARAIRSGEIELAIAGGAESMTRAPLVMGKAESAFQRSAKLHADDILIAIDTKTGIAEFTLNFFCQIIIAGCNGDCRRIAACRLGCE